MKKKKTNIKIRTGGGTGILVLDNGENNFAATDKQFLSWIYDRLVFVYGENESYDYMHRLKKIIDGMG